MYIDQEGSNRTKFCFHPTLKAEPVVKAFTDVKAAHLVEKHCYPRAN